MEQALKVLRQDRQLRSVLETTPLRIPRQNEDVYLTLLKSIIEQQVSLKAAATIWGRFQALWKDYPHPQEVLRMEKEALQRIGTSFQKVAYLKNIAQFAVDGELDPRVIAQMDDPTAIKHLCQIKGVGKWTAEMILMFSLGRKDVFPVDDLAIRNAMIQLYGLKSEKKALFMELDEIAQRWRPYRSYASYLLWDWYEGKGTAG